MKFLNAVAGEGLSILSQLTTVDTKSTKLGVTLQQTKPWTARTLEGSTTLGWQHPRRVAYIHRHPQLDNHCLYHWNHQEGSPEQATSQDLVLLLQDIYVEVRGEFKAMKLLLDGDMGTDGRIRLVCGFNTTCSTTLLSSLCALSPDLLVGPICFRFRPGSSQGVVLPSLFVDSEWVDGRPLRRDDKGSSLPPIDLLKEVQAMLRFAKQLEHLPHQVRKAKAEVA